MAARGCVGRRLYRRPEVRVQPVDDKDAGADALAIRLADRVAECDRHAEWEQLWQPAIHTDVLTDRNPIAYPQRGGHTKRERVANSKRDRHGRVDTDSEFDGNGNTERGRLAQPEWDELPVGD